MAGSDGAQHTYLARSFQDAQAHRGRESQAADDDHELRHDAEKAGDQKQVILDDPALLRHELPD